MGVEGPVWYGEGLSLQNQRPSNMDSIVYQTRGGDTGEMLLAVVCDGVGSTRDGAFASQYCATALKDWFRSASEQRVGLSLRDHVLRLNTELLELTQTQGLETATTLSALLLAGGQSVVVHIGDSRIYRYRAGELQQITVDDVSAAGRLTGCIGRWENIRLYYDEESADAQGYFLCSDGLYKGMEKERMQAYMARNSRFCRKRRLKRMADEAIANGSKDNISAILIRQKK